MLDKDSKITAKLVGHTDNQGTEGANQSLSQARAKAVYDVLLRDGIAENRLSYEGMGESSPVATNNTAEGRRTNRRTEFITYGGTAVADCNSYKTRSYQKLTSDATVNTTEVPAQYETRTFQKLASDASTSSVEIPAQYGTRSYQKLANQAASNSDAVAAQYETRSYQKLVSPASTTSTEIPAEYKTLTKRQLVKKGGFTEWREVVCESDITSDLVRRVQNALIAKGYNLGAAGADNDMGPSTKAALVKFQRENNLPIGSLDFETLKALGVSQ
ncbi:UNVERIFIED_CONTAM: hypothetical protein GTU68_030631 [Idotea baltica]|nr:hypothetical protein [Idotea baltica]